MTCSTTFGELTFEKIEWRSHAVMARASEAIVKSQIAQSAQQQIAQFSRRAQQRMSYLKILISVRRISDLMQELVDLIHSVDSIPLLEAATPEQLARLAQSMRDVHEKVERFDLMIRPTRYWRSWFRTELAKLRAHNDEIAAHLQAFCSTDTALLFLTKKDQDQLLNGLSNPQAATAKLRRAFAQEV